MYLVNEPICIFIGEIVSMLYSRNESTRFLGFRVKPPWFAQVNSFQRVHPSPGGAESNLKRKLACGSECLAFHCQLLELLVIFLYHLQLTQVLRNTGMIEAYKDASFISSTLYGSPAIIVLASRELKGTE
ncbi:hypothetical protein ACFE04_004041 [Oxalis oulophora]